MKRQYSISFYLDTRRELKSGLYPVKLRVFTTTPRKQKLYSTIFEFSKEEFQSTWETKKPRVKFQDNRNKLEKVLHKAKAIAEDLKPFTLEAFERVWNGIPGQLNKNVNFYYQQAIDNLTRNGQVSTASNYDLSLKSLLKFHGKETLDFYEITVQWLREFETFMILEGKSQTTVGMYLRPLRTVFNTARKDKAIPFEMYPFGSEKEQLYTIPDPKSVKKALTKGQMKTLFEGTPQTPEQAKAKAFFFFSYSCNGINFKDIALLKFKNMEGDKITFRRAKTARTKKDQLPVTIYLTDFAKAVIHEYGNDPDTPNNYIFRILSPGDNPKEIRRKVSNFVRFVNQHLEKYTKDCGLTEKVSTYFARHSFATIAIQNGATMEFVSEALSHSNMNTTRNYFKGFEDVTKKEVSEKLMTFD